MTDQVHDVIFREQVSGHRGDLPINDPHRRLMFAVLLDAIAHLRRGDTRGAREARRWIRVADGDAAAPFSFRSVCEALGIDPAYLARGLLAACSVQGVIGLPRRRLRIAHLRMTPPRARRRAGAAAGAERTRLQGSAGGI